MHRGSNILQGKDENKIWSKKKTEILFMLTYAMRAVSVLFIKYPKLNSAF